MLPKPPKGYLDKAEAETLLGRFVHGGRFDAPTPLPKRVNPRQASDFIRKVLEESELKRGQAAQSGMVMRFYDLRERTEQIPRWLDRRERTPAELDRSEELVAVLGELGDPAQQKQAADYYGFIAGQRSAPREFRRLANRFASLGEGADPKSITGPIEARMKALEPKMAGNVDAEVEYKELDPIVNAFVPDAVKAWKRKQAILAVKDVARRRQDLARCYVALEEYPGVDMKMWAVAMLQHEANESSPIEVAATFNQLIELLMTPASVPGPTGQKLSPEDEKRVVTSCARASEFYGAALKPEQAAFVAGKQKPAQNDILYWEPE